MLDIRVNRRQYDKDETAKVDEERSHLVHRVGQNAGSTLFPGWGPKI